jgi:MoaA/NifB/PqqE/SkfB family radical SAM enzyme
MKTTQLATRIFSGFLKYKIGRPSPLFASYNVTGRCNMECGFCEWWKNEIPELGTKKALAVIDSVCNLGISFFDFSGGEPLLRKDLFTLAKRVSSFGCLVSMNTNGTLLNEKNVRQISEVFDTVVVSLDGPKNVHDILRGVPGTYEKAVNAIELLKENGLRTGINCVVTPTNIKVLPKFIENFLKNIDFFQVQPIHPYPPFSENIPEETDITEFVRFLLEIKHANPGILAVPTEFIKGFGPYFKIKSQKICHAGDLYVAINPGGKLLACPARSDILLGNILDTSVCSLIQNKKNKEWKKVTECKGCWLECTVGVSMLLSNPLVEFSNLLSLWRNKSD